MAKPSSAVANGGLRRSDDGLSSEPGTRPSGKIPTLDTDDWTSPMGRTPTFTRRLSAGGFNPKRPFPPPECLGLTCPALRVSPDTGFGGGPKLMGQSGMELATRGSPFMPTIEGKSMRHKAAFGSAVAAAAIVGLSQSGYAQQGDTHGWLNTETLKTRSGDFEFKNGYPVRRYRRAPARAPEAQSGDRGLHDTDDAGQRDRPARRHAGLRSARSRRRS